MKKLKYELTEGEVNFIIMTLDRAPITGAQQAKDLLYIINLLQNPIAGKETQMTPVPKIPTK